MIYAIGDAHGCAAELTALLSKIDPQPGDAVVFLGDYIDRGPDSKRVIEIVRSYQPDGVEVVTLKGNHEDMMVKVHDQRGLWDWWVGNGGGSCLESYSGHIPEDVLAWARNLPVRYERDGYLFVHAGVDPDVPLAEQEEEALLWIRTKFLKSTNDYGAIIVHGHTPNEKPEVRPNRINVDTACVYGEQLTCVVLGGPKPTFISERAHDRT